MTKASTREHEAPTSARRTAPGALTAGVVELATSQDGEAHYKVRLLGGELIDARLGPGCEEELVAECLAQRRTVLLSGGAILGALQTSPSQARSDVDGNVRVEGGDVVVEAGQALTLRAGDTELLLREDGTVRLVGQRLSMDVAALIKLLSARVELP